LLILSPFAPHLAEELREWIGNKFSIFNSTERPIYDNNLLLEDVINLAIQFNGKMRWTLEVDPNLWKDEIMNLLAENEKFSKYLEWNIIKIIFIPRRIINIIIK
jgi:leucyl-tRNA synthetase